MIAVYFIEHVANISIPFCFCKPVIVKKAKCHTALSFKAA